MIYIYNLYPYHFYIQISALQFYVAEINTTLPPQHSLPLGTWLVVNNLTRTQHIFICLPFFIYIRVTNVNQFNIFSWREHKAFDVLIWSIWMAGDKASCSRSAANPALNPRDYAKCQLYRRHSVARSYTCSPLIQTGQNQCIRQPVISRADKRGDILIYHSFQTLKCIFTSIYFMNNGKLNSIAIGY